MVEDIKGSCFFLNQASTHAGISVVLWEGVSCAIQLTCKGFSGIFAPNEKGKCYVESVAYGTGQDLIDRSSIFIQTGSDPYELHSLTAQRSASEDTP